MKVNKFYSSNEYLPVFKMYETTHNDIKYVSNNIALPSRYTKKDFIESVLKDENLGDSAFLDAFVSNENKNKFI